VHAIYRGSRIEARFDPRTHAVTITTDGPLQGHAFTTPSGARAAVVTHLNPDVSPIGNGWTFWTVPATGARLHTLRRHRYR
jgi:hypothetical protein